MNTRKDINEVSAFELSNITGGRCIEGDLNDDGTVDFSDFLIAAEHYKGVLQTADIIDNGHEMPLIEFFVKFGAAQLGFTSGEEYRTHHYNKFLKLKDNFGKSC